MNQQQITDASRSLKFFGVEAPYTEENYLKMIKAHQDWWLNNSDIKNVEPIRIGEGRNSLEYYAALQEAANEIKANRGR